MRANITRTITETTIKSAQVVIELGVPIVTENDPMTVTGSLSEEKALKLARKEYGVNTHVTEVKEDSALYEISVKDFIAHATKVEVASSEEEEPKEEV